jgi:hypothetical protein
MTDLLTKLRSDEAIADLARLVVADLLGRPPAEVVDARFTAELVQRSLQGWLASDAAEQRIITAVEDLRSRLSEDERRLEDVVPAEVVSGARQLSARAYSPDRETLLAILDREPVHRLVREILRETLVEFGQKLRAPVADNRVAKSLGGLGRFARSKATGKSGSISALAGGLVGAVSGEVERQVERRAAEFADGAISGVLQRLADELCDPRRVDDQAALRGALLDGVLGLRGVDAAKELDNADPTELVGLVRTLLTEWADDDDLADSIAEVVDNLLAEVDAPTLGDLLDDSIRNLIGDLAGDLLRRRLGPLFASDAFGAWFAALDDAE